MYDFDDLERMASDWERTAQADLARAENLAHTVAALTGEAADRSGAVKITVDAAGALVDVRVDARAMSWPPHRLSQTILDTSAAARRDYATAATARAREILGANGTSLAVFEAGLRERTPADPKPKEQW